MIAYGPRIGYFSFDLEFLFSLGNLDDLLSGRNILKLDLVWLYSRYIRLPGVEYLVMISIPWNFEILVCFSFVLVAELA